MATISQDMTIAEILSLFPQHSQKLAHAITSAGLHCVGCNAASYETLEAGMLGHGMSIEDVASLLTKLNAILSETIDTSTISLTQRAAEKFSLFATEEGHPLAALRFGLLAAGCSGYEYELDFDTNPPAAKDEVFDSHGVKIHVHKSCLEKLRGCVIDYVDGLTNTGFKISNPNAKSACGCGKSQGF